MIKINIKKTLLAVEFKKLNLNNNLLTNPINKQSFLTFIFSCILIFTTKIFGQEIPNEFFLFKKNKILIDIGQNWDSHSTFGPIRFQEDNNSIFSMNDTLLLCTRHGIKSKNSDLAFYGFGHFSFRKYFYGYIYSRIVNNINTFPRYSGIPREMDRLGFNSGETDIAGMGFQNNWALFQIGRGRQSWGAGNEIQLALNELSPAYDYALAGLDFGQVRMRYIHGYLESDSLSVNRYISVRGVEWTNLHSLVISLSEATIYSGINRPFDFAYVNPISTHLEIELNNRQNRLGSDSGNAVWQTSFDWMIKPNLRISGNLLFDEFVLDNIQRDAGKNHSYAYSGRIGFNPLKSKTTIITTYLSLINIGTATFRHEDGNNNFVHRGKPLGWEYGSDGKEIKFGLNYVNVNSLIANFEIGERQMGQESIYHRPYEPYVSYLIGKFPSGEVDRTLFISSEMQWWWKKNISFVLEAEWIDSSNIGNEFDFNFGVDIFFPSIMKINKPR